MLRNTVQDSCKGQQTLSTSSLPFIKRMVRHMLPSGEKKQTKKKTTNCSLSNVLCCTGCSRFSRYYSSDMSTPASQPLLKKKWKQNGWNDWMWLYGGSLGSHVLYHGLQVHVLRCYFRCDFESIMFFLYGGRRQGGFLFPSWPHPINAVLCVEMCWGPQM